MEKKEKLTVYLPQRLYAEVFDRQLAPHFSFLVSLLVEEFIRATDVRISWIEMPNRADQKVYLEKKIREFFSMFGRAEPSKPSVQERFQKPVEPPRMFIRVEPTEPFRASMQEVAETSKPVENPSSPPVQERVEPTYTPPSSPVSREENTPLSKKKAQELELDEEVLRRIESFW
jgi:hypothetical protein